MTPGSVRDSKLGEAKIIKKRGTGHFITSSNNVDKKWQNYTGKALGNKTIL